jgi:hypothetical protein
MSTFTAFCSDFYVNQKLALKLDLPERRETVLDLFDRVRRTFPRLSTFQRYDGEVALESDSSEREWQWVALRQTTIRSGHVNPATLADSYNFHKALLEVAPYFLSISPLDVDMLEVVFGFDFETEHDRDEVVFDALLEGTRLAGLVDRDTERIADAQPSLAISLGGRGVAGERGGDPISVFLTVRRFGPLASLDELKSAFGAVVGHAEILAENRVIPHVVVPIHEALQARG